MKKLLLILPLGLLLLFPTPASAIWLSVNLQGEIEVYQDQVLGEETDQDDVEIENLLQEVEKEVTGQVGEPVRTPQPEVQRKITPNLPKSQEIRLRPSGKSETTIQVYEQQKRGELIRTPADRPEAELKEEIKADRVRLEFNDNKSELREEQRRNAVELREAEQKSLNLNAEDGREMLYEENAEAVRKLEELKYELNSEGEYRKMTIQDTVTDDVRQIRLESPDGSASRLINGELILETDNNVVRVATPDGIGRELRTFPDEVVDLVENEYVLPEDVRTDMELEIREDGSLYHRLPGIERKERVFGIFQIKVRGDAVVDDATGEVEFESTETNPLKQFLRVFRRR